VTTERGDTVFVHVLDWPDRVLALPTLGARVVGARMFATGERVEARQSETGVVLTLPAGSQTSGAEDPDRVVVLTLEARRK
jgi:alpha-L-fucosidase